MSDSIVYRKDVYNALVEKGQASRRYKVGEEWELNGKEIREALENVPSAEMSDNIAYEEYTLILKHEIVNGDKTYQLDEPLIIKHISFASPRIQNLIISNTYLLNEMMDKLKRELIQRAVKND